MAATLSSISVTCGTPRLDGSPTLKSQTINSAMNAVKLPNMALHTTRIRSPKGFNNGANKNTKTVVAMATGESAEAGINTDEILKSVEEVWNKVEDKYAVLGLGFVATIALWGSTGLIAAIDKLPIVPSLFELVGIIYSAWFTYRNLLFKPDREALLKKIEENLDQITGSK